MSRFVDVAGVVDDSEVEVFGGKEKLSALLSDLDRSWDATSRTTLGVMMAVMACAKDKEPAHRCLSGMLGMLWKMSAVYCGMLSGMDEPVAQSEMLERSRAIDVAGEELSKKVDGLGMAVMMGLLAALPGQWMGHFLKVASLGAISSKVLAFGSFRGLTWQVAEVQKGKSEWLRRVADSSVFALNSVPMRRAMEWAKGAGGVYDAVMAGGFDGPVALAEAIRKVGFPDALGGQDG